MHIGFSIDRINKVHGTEVYYNGNSGNAMEVAYNLSLDDLVSQAMAFPVLLSVVADILHYYGNNNFTNSEQAINNAASIPHDLGILINDKKTLLIPTGDFVLMLLNGDFKQDVLVKAVKTKNYQNNKLLNQFYTTDYTNYFSHQYLTSCDNVMVNNAHVNPYNPDGSTIYDFGWLDQRDTIAVTSTSANQPTFKISYLNKFHHYLSRSWFGQYWYEYNLPREFDISL